MKIDWLFWGTILLAAVLFTVIQPSTSDSVSLRSSFDARYPGCQILKLEAPYSTDSEETVIAKMDTSVHDWLQQHPDYTLVGTIDSMKSVSSDGELNVFYLVRSKTSI